MLDINIIFHIKNNSDLDYKSRIEDIKQIFACTDFAELNITGDISLLIADNKYIRKLNNEFRNKDSSTNVLAFPNDSDNQEEEKYLGDIIISVEKLKEEALEQNKSYESHFMHLTIHGILHILGHDHINKIDRENMENLEISLLNKLGYKNPYQIS